MATQTNTLRRARFPKIARRPCSALNDLDPGLEKIIPVSEGEPTSHSAISMPVPKATDPTSIASSPQEITEVDFAELKGGTLVELIEDSAGRPRLAVWKDGHVRFADSLEIDSHVFVPLAGKDEVLRNLRLPSAVMPYGSTQELLCRLESFISRCVAIDEKFVPVLADFVLSTWFVDRFSVAPYLSVVGLPQSGKTTLLKVLSLVCRRSLLIGEITSASFYRACARFLPTVLIDETATVANDRTLRHILRTGTTRDVVAVRRNHVFHSYGAKVISWLEPPNDPALNSRCILIPMFESTSTVVARTEEPAVQQRAADLQAQLLQFRFENYKRVQPAPVPGDEILRPRTRDLLRSLTAAHVDPERSQRLLQFFESGQCISVEPLSVEHNAVLRVLFAFIHAREDFTAIWITDLTKQVNLFLELAGERLSLQPRKVGAVLTSLGFSSRTRTNSGWVISLSQRDAQRLHHLAASYGIDGMSDEFLRVSPADCELCRAVDLDKEGLASAPEGTTRKKVDLRKELSVRVGW